MIVAVVGPRQSGSTLLFNLVRWILASQGITHDACGIQAYKMGLYSKDVECLIVKSHNFDQELLDASSVVLLPIRDFRDCAISFHQRFKSLRCTSDIIGYVLDNMKQYEDWEPHDDYIFNYERYMESKNQHIRDIADILKVQLTDEDIMNIIKQSTELHMGVACPLDDNINEDDRIRMMINDTAYRTTLMTQKHNTSNGAIGKYRKEMPQYVINKISMNVTIQGFFKKHGYALR